MKQYFDVAIHVTAVQFDGTIGYPTRLLVDGRDISAERMGCGQLVSFYYKGSYYWLRRVQTKWRLLSGVDAATIFQAIE